MFKYVYIYIYIQQMRSYIYIYIYIYITESSRDEKLYTHTHIQKKYTHVLSCALSIMKQICLTNTHSLPYIYTRVTTYTCAMIQQINPSDTCQTSEISSSVTCQFLIHLAISFSFLRCACLLVLNSGTTMYTTVDYLHLYAVNIKVQHSIGVT